MNLGSKDRNSELLEGAYFAGPLPSYSNIRQIADPHRSAMSADLSGRSPASERARRALDQVRSEFGAAVGVRSDEIFFVGDGAMAATLTLQGLAAARPGRIRASAIERSEVLAICNERLPVESDGRLQPIEVAGDEILALGWVNGEVGTIQRIDAIGAQVRLAGARVHVDLSHGLGVLPPPTEWDSAIVDATSFGGPTLGIMAVRSRTRWQDPLPTLSPTLNPLRVSLTTVLEAADALRQHQTLVATEHNRIAHFLRQVRQIASTMENIDLSGCDPDSISGIPHIMTFSALYAQGDTLLEAFAREKFFVASGSACSSSALEPSHVLVATGKLTHGNIRLTIPFNTPQEYLDRFLMVLPRVIGIVREQV